MQAGIVEFPSGSTPRDAGSDTPVEIEEFRALSLRARLKLSEWRRVALRDQKPVGLVRSGGAPEAA
jgi:hypothetical protein